MQIGDPTDTGAAHSFLILDRQVENGFFNAKSKLQMPYHLVLCHEFGVEPKNAGRNGRFVRL
jgi:hypothetical protein